MKIIDPEKKSTELIQFIKDTCTKEKRTDILIGLSGGIDSATSLTLAVKALGKDHVYPILMPYGNLSDQGTSDAWLVIDSLEIPHEHVEVIDIKPLVDSVAAYDDSINDSRRGSIMARMRMVVLYDLVKKYGYKHMVLGTENLTEHLLGYYTRFGDEASDIEPLRNLYKYQVFELAKFLKIPEQIITKSPTAGLWEGQTDEGELGFTYKDADEVLYFYFEEKLSQQQVIGKGYSEELVTQVWKWIDTAEYKDRLPYQV
ncbi:NAD+ synthase [soil metagenome]